MVKFLSVGCALFSALTFAAPNFENPGGMWLPPQMNLHQEVLKEFKVDYADKLTDPSAFPLAAIGQFHEFGCSAAFISNKGLIATNHHCAGLALNNNHKDHPGIQENGYLAKNQGEELSAGPGHGFRTTSAITEVTETVLKDLANKTPDEKKKIIQQRGEELSKKCEEGKEHTKCEVKGFFEGAKFYLLEYFQLQDIRLVYAPPASVGAYGGDVDNFRWPRHTGDFAIFRAYVGPDGKPAPFAEGNKPFEPAHALKVAKEPLKEGDFVLVAGFPGQTGRFKTSFELDYLVKKELPRRRDLFKRLIKEYDKLREIPELKELTQNFYSYYQNFLIVYEGSLSGLKAAKAVQAKKEVEARLQEFISSSAENKEKYGKVLKELAKNARRYNDKKRDRDTELVALLAYGLPRYGSHFNLGLGIVSKKLNLLKAAYVIARKAKERLKDDANRAPDFKEANWEAIENDLVVKFTKYYDPRVDSAEMRAVLERSVRLPFTKRPIKALKAILKKRYPTRKDIQKKVEKYYSETKLGDAEERKRLLGVSFEELQKSEDPFIKVALKLLPLYEKVEKRYLAYEGTVQSLAPAYVGAIVDSSKTPVAPDANTTLRLTFGTVRGYKETPQAEVKKPFTVLAGMTAKHTGKEPFNLPEEVRKQAEAGNIGNYKDAELGDLPINFIADLDITNGSSGSSAINAKGELIGFAFDGNYESIPGRWHVDPKRARTIMADVRYMLWMLDAVHKDGDWILKEMGVTPHLEPK